MSSAEPEAIPTRPFQRIPAIFITVSVIYTLVNLPLVANWWVFLFCDTGASLAVLDLTRHHDRPNVDNGYIYGLLPLQLSRSWYGILGITPFAFLAMWSTFNVLIAWGFARFARFSRATPSGIALLLVSVPIAGIQSMVHMLEPTLLIHALAEQARGRDRVALTLVTMAAFVKPSMAMVYGLVLLIIIVRKIVKAPPGQTRLARLMHELLPATVVGVALLASLTLIYGAPAMIQSIVPLRARGIYQALNFGFFRGGRDFWLPPGGRITYFLGTAAGFWLLGTLILFLGAIAGCLRWFRERKTSESEAPMANFQVVNMCAILHAVFIFLFFGSRASYGYYLYLIPMGLAALTPRSRGYSRLLCLLVPIVLLSHYTTFKASVNAYRHERRSPETLGLWATSEQSREWVEVRRFTKGDRAVLLAENDGAALFFPEFAPPTLYVIVPVQMTELETKRKLDQIAKTRLVVETHDYFGEKWNTDRWPVFMEATRDFEIVFEGKLFRVLRRR